jgi:crotonobetainyl-CoA:carnitine CoA-transferase CaiB-like acyl-CoA transferase
MSEPQHRQAEGESPDGGPFDGVRVIELAQWVFVPVAGALLADWGADVIHIEPTEGDPYRGLASQGIGTERGGVNLSLALANRGKRSLALDIQTEQGQAVLHRLLENADVLLTNMRPKALRRLGLDADSVTSRYPMLVFARGTGYGIRGPDADQAGYDSTAFWSRGGLAHMLTSPDLDYPVGQRGAMGDRNGAMALAFGVAAALLKRTRTGSGSVVDVSLLASAMWTLSSDVLAALGGDQPTASRGRGPLLNPVVGTYRTKDARHIQLVFLQADRYWADFCSLINRKDLIDDPRYKTLQARRENAAACVAELDGEFAKRTFAEWKELLAGLDAPWAPIQSVPELLDDPQVQANGYIGDVEIDGERAYRLPAVPVQFDGHPPPLRRGPEHGEDTETVLAEIGYDWDEILDLKESGVIL